MRITKDERALFAQRATEELDLLVRDAKREILIPMRLAWLLASLRALETDSIASAVSIAEELYTDDLERKVCKAVNA